MKIIQHEEAPRALLQIIIDHYEPITTIDTVILIGGDKFGLMHGKMAVFNPDTGGVIIDMAACIKDQRWMARGMAFVPNVWCNLVYSVFHEGAHAMQLMNDEIVFDESTWDLQCEILDHTADIMAIEQMIDWFEIHTTTPPLDQLGWVGKRIQNLFNKVYSKAPDAINAEMDLIGTEAGGFAAMAAQGPDFEEHEIPGLMKAIGKGDIGLIIKNRPCLRMDEILGADREVRS